MYLLVLLLVGWLYQSGNPYDGIHYVVELVFVFLLSAPHSLLLMHIVYCWILLQVPIAIGGSGLAPGVRFRKDVPDGGLANVAATVMNLHGFVAPSDYEPTLIEVADN